ncbi:MAG: HlyC/CorC family transporter [Clostridia bacterium]|nr:HlyC/CorC family transporter [Clostridia bacterium]
MDPDSIRPILFMLILVALSAYFSATETAFSSFNRIRLKSLAEDGNKKAALVLKMAEDYDKLLSTILVGNNIVNILLTTVATIFFVKLSAAYGATLSTVVTTVVVLIFGEISPKSLAKEYADSFTMATAPILRCVIVLLTPVNWVFSQWKKLLNLLFKSGGEQAVTEEELLTIVDEAEQGGSLDEKESDMIRQVIAFNDREAQDILIPRVEVTGIPLDATAAELAQVFEETDYSRLPVYEDTIDRIVGIVHYKDFHRAQAPASPATLMKPAVFITPTMKMPALLDKLQAEKTHLAVVSDEYGGTLGIVTMEDVLEELVGEIWDEHDDVIETMRPDGEEGDLLVLCSTELEDLMEHFGRETDCEAATVSGWVMEATGCIPAEGDTFVADGLAVTVTKVGKTHPEEIRVRAVEEPAEEKTDKPKRKKESET